MAETREQSLTALLEDLLSKKSLSKDQQIRAAIDSQMQVPAAVLAAHPLVVNAAFAAAGPPVTVADVLAAAAQSKKLHANVKENSVKPQLKLRRNVLVVSEAPASVERAEVEALVKSGAKVTVKEVRLEAPGAWFVKLKDEEHCRRAAVGLRERVWACGEPVVAAIKAVHVHRGFCDAVQATAGAAWDAAALALADEEARVEAQFFGLSAPAVEEDVAPGLGSAGVWRPWGAARAPFQCATSVELGCGAGRTRASGSASGSAGRGSVGGSDGHQQIFGYEDKEWRSRGWVDDETWTAWVRAKEAYQAEHGKGKGKGKGASRPELNPQSNKAARELSNADFPALELLAH